MYTLEQFKMERDMNATIVMALPAYYKTDRIQKNSEQWRQTLS
jgi:hypothetical protein